MTETRRASSKSSGSASGSRSAAKRDAYDEFLERTDRAPAKNTSRGTAKRSDSAAPVGSSAARRRSTAPSSAKSTSAKSGTPYEKDMLAVWRELSGENRSGQTESRQRHSEDSARRPQRPSGAQRPQRPPQRSAAGRHTAAHVSTQKSTPKRPSAGRRDAYDDFLDNASAPKRRKPKGKKGLTLLLTAGILTLAVMMGVQYNRYQEFLVMKNAVEREGFYEGTTVEGVDVSGMTLQQAMDLWEQDIEPGYAQRRVTLDNGAAFTAEELGYTSDYANVLANAWGAGRSGSLEERYAAISSRREQPVSYQVTRTPYSQAAVDSCVTAIAAQIDREAADAKIQSFDMDTYSFQFSAEVIGSRLDQDKLRTDISNALNAGEGSVVLSVQAIQPAVTLEGISAKYGMITAAVTNASSSSKNRLSNIRRAMEIINGTRLRPGETFSFNQVVGERTKDRGFKVAPAYASGKVVDEVGGGICQVSTTLFNAAVKADLTIVERHNHSLTVSYVDKGKDAAVDWGNKDLKFTNNSDDDVYICCFVDDDKRVRFGIFGKLLPNGETITVEAETTGRVSYDTEYVPNPALPTGLTRVTREGKKGYTAEAYKVRWSADGDKISSELLCESTYRATDKVVEYGP